MFEDKQLIVKWDLGDIHALRQIYDKYKDRLVTLAAALLYDKTAAEDAVHEVFARLLEKKDRLRITQNLSHYLFVCVANTSRNLNRQKHPTPIDYEQSETMAFQSAQSLPEQPAILKEQADKLTEALSRLPYEQREVILLRHYCDLKFRNIAEVQNIPLNTAQGRYRYGMEQLRTLLDGEIK